MDTHRLIVVTGGAGFIGAHMARRLAHAGGRVVLVDHLGQGDKWRNIADIELEEIVTPPQVDTWLERFGPQVQAVVHLGAITDTRARDVDALVRDNCQASLLWWRFCTAHQVPFLYASSAATYGDGTRGFDDTFSLEALGQLRPLNAYGWSKHVMDRHFCTVHARGEPRPPRWAGLKFFNVYGPGEAHKGDMASLISQQGPAVAAGAQLRLFKSTHPDFADGEQRRDFVFVDDCCEVMRLMLELPGLHGLYNVGSGVASTWLDVASALEKALGRRVEIDFIDMPERLRGQYQNFSQANLNRLRQAGIRMPMTPLNEGVARTLSHIVRGDARHG